MAKRRGNGAYWQVRFAALEEEQYQRSAAYHKDVQSQFRMASKNIQMGIERWYGRLADNNDISYAGAKKLLKKNELEEFQWTVEQYIKAGEENAIDGRWMKELENASARHHISYLTAMRLQVQQHAELLSVQYEGGVADFLNKVYAENFYKSAFEIARGTGVGSNLAALDTRKIDIMIRKPWAQDGANFSDRIWTNKKKLVNNLHTELTQNIIRGASPQKAIDSLAKTMEVSRSQAGTLIMTESAAISAKAQQDCFKELGVEEFEVVETLDGHTCKICQGMDGMHFPMPDYKVGETAPPFHPRCRGCTAPYFADELTAGEQRAARDEKTGKTYYVPADMKYKEWKEQFVKTLDADEKIRTSDVEQNKKKLDEMKPVTSKISWSNHISGCDEKLLNEAHTELNKTMIYDHVEILSIIEKGNTEVYYQKGNEIDVVNLSKDTISRLKNAPDNSIVLSHVHPNKTTFSRDDIKKLIDFSSISDLTLECPDGAKYIMSRGTYKHSVFGKLRFDSAYNAVYNEVAMQYPELSDSVKIYDIWDNFILDVNRSVAKKFGFVFKEIQ